jgi:hypothetical protein
LEEIAWHNRWIKRDQLLSLISKYGNSSYAEYLKLVLERQELNP